jgi:hypothetical protein
MIPNEKYDNGLFKNIMPTKVGNYVFKKPASKSCCPIRLPTTLKENWTSFLCMRKPQEFLSMEWAIARRELRSLRVGIETFSA